MAKGDKLCIVRGAKAPSSFEKPAGGINDTGPRFTLIGDFYIHGLMTGESLPAVGPFQDIALQ